MGFAANVLTAPPAAEHVRVAALFTGWQNTPFDAANLNHHLLRPLHAEAILLLTHTANDGCDSVTSCGLRKRFAKLEPIARLALEPMPTTVGLLRTLEALPHWPAILKSFNRTLVRNQAAALRMISHTKLSCYPSYIHMCYTCVLTACGIVISRRHECSTGKSTTSVVAGRGTYAAGATRRGVKAMSG